MRRFLIYWLPAIVWAAVILAASSDLFSSMHTEQFLRELLLRLFGSVPGQPVLETSNLVIRKCAHLFEYSLLSALLFRAIRAEAGTRWLMPWAVRAILLTAAVASIDEFHQTFVASRTGAFSDVLLDTAGAILVQLLIRGVQVLIFRTP